MAAGFTQVEYNGVTISNCELLKFEQTPEFDRTGQTLLYYVYKIRVSGFFLSGQNASFGIAPVVPNGTAGDNYQNIRNLLVRRARAFSLSLGHGQSGTAPVQIVSALPAPDDGSLLSNQHDRANGPIPNLISFDKVTANNTIKIQWEVTVHLRPNCDSQESAQNENGVLSNRWTCADDINEDWFTTRVFAGEVKLSHPYRNPHDYRFIALPPLQPGMRRKHMHFESSADGLSLSYRILDEEVTITPPSIATEIKISHRETTAEWGQYVMTTMSVELKGDHLVDKKELIALAATIISGKLRLDELVPRRNIDENRPVRVLSYDVMDEVGSNQDNRIRVSIQLKRLPGRNEQILGQEIMQRVSATLGTPIDEDVIDDYNNTLSRGNRDGESNLPYGPLPAASALAVHLQNECTWDYSCCNGYLFNERDASILADSRECLEVPTFTLSVSEYTELPDETFSDSHSEGIYQTYNIDSQYGDQTLISQMPIASGLSGGSGGTGGEGSDPPADEQGSVFVQLGPIQFTRVLRVLAERFGKPPRLPNAQASFVDADGVQHVLLSKDFVTQEPTRSPDGEAYNYVTRAEYVYGLSKQPKKVKTGIPDFERAADTDDVFEFARDVLFSSDHSI